MPPSTRPTPPAVKGMMVKSASPSAMKSATLTMHRNHRRQIQVHNRVAIQDQKRLTSEIIAQDDQRTTGAEQSRLWRVRNRKAERLAAAERRFDLICEMMHVDGDLANARVAKQEKRIVNQRPAADFDQRLWNRIGNRPQAFAVASRQHQRFH